MCSIGTKTWVRVNAPLLPLMKAGVVNVSSEYTYAVSNPFTRTRTVPGVPAQDPGRSWTSSLTSIAAHLDTTPTASELIVSGYSIYPDAFTYGPMYRVFEIPVTVDTPGVSGTHVGTGGTVPAGVGAPPDTNR